MPLLYHAALVAEISAAITATGLVRWRPSHRSAAVALFLLTMVAELRGGTVIALRGLAHPFEDAALWILTMDGALFLASGAVVAGLGVTLTSPPEERGRAARIVGGAWALASLALAVAYPLVVLTSGMLLAPDSPWRGSTFLSTDDAVQIGILAFFTVSAVAQGVLWIIYARRLRSGR